VRPAWNQGIGAVQFPLTVAVNGGVLTVAASDGSVAAIEAESGRTVWRLNVGAKISAGCRQRRQDGCRGHPRRRPARHRGRRGEVGRSPFGRPRRHRAAGAGARVFVLGVDRAVQGFDAADGAKLWQVQRPGDPLTLSQTGVITAYKNTLVVGQGPRMAGIDPVGRVAALGGADRLAARRQRGRAASPT
jgi:outer membrane protein assembly factor BamB